MQNWFESIWDLFAKFTKEKQKRKREKKRKKGKGPRETIRPKTRTGPRPSNTPARTGTLPSLSLSLTAGPLVIPLLHHRAEISPMNVERDDHGRL
jgi:hypothetical protein